ncbi:MAG: hypothetical protein EBZ74_09460, partial [Planctomycetia bacterium]|nr:hypothetical protein [Planctomycetia bacterium]
MRVSRLTRLVWLGICLALLCGRSARGGTIYWNMNDLATPTSNNLANLVVSALTQGNSSTTGTSGQVPSSGYPFTLSGS